MTNAALILQGPVLSGGYDSNDNISKTIEAFGPLFDTIVITTWKGSGLRPVSYAHPRVVVVESDDVGTGNDLNGLPVGNRWRHLMGTGFGLDALASSGFASGYVIKQRSDQTLDLRAMLEHMRQNDLQNQEYRSVGQDGFLYFLLLCRNNPYVANDFVFAGHFKDVVHLVEAASRYRHLIFRESPTFPEGDMLQKYIYMFLRPHYPFADYRYFPRIQKYHTSRFVRKYPVQILELWGEVIRTSVSVFPRDVSKNLLWRGKPWYPRALEPNPFIMFSEEWNRYRSNIQSSVSGDLSAIFDLHSRREDRTFFYLDERALQAQSGKRHAANAFVRRLYRKLIAYSHRSIFNGPEYASPWNDRVQRLKSRLKNVAAS